MYISVQRGLTSRLKQRKIPFFHCTILLFRDKYRLSCNTFSSMRLLICSCNTTVRSLGQGPGWQLSHAQFPRKTVTGHDVRDASVITLR